jgi:hypothetical protein
MVTKPCLVATNLEIILWSLIFFLVLIDLDIIQRGKYGMQLCSLLDHEHC